MLHKREVNLQVNFIIVEKMNAAKQAVKEGCRTPEGVQRMEIATMPKRNLENAKRNLLDWILKSHCQRTALLFTDKRLCSPDEWLYWLRQPKRGAMPIGQQINTVEG